MNSVNLIPAHRLQVRRGRGRLRLWSIVVPAGAAVLLMVYGINLASWDTDTGPAATALKETEAKIKEMDGKIAALKREVREQRAVLRANRAVGEQPDWGSMLSLLASRLGEDAVLSACTVEPVAPEATAKPGSAPEVGRPQKLRVTLKGQSRTQEAASRFVIELEKAGVFDRVTLVETRRAEPPEEDIAFEIVCALSDSGAMTK